MTPSAFEHHAAAFMLLHLGERFGVLSEEAVHPPPSDLPEAAAAVGVGPASLTSMVI